MAVITRAQKVVDRALKEQYGKYMDLMNYGTEFIRQLSVSGERFVGRKFLVPIRTTKIQPGRFVAETGAQPDPVAAQSDYLQFDVAIYIAKLATTWVAQEFDSGSVVMLSRDLEDWIKANNENLEYASLFGHRVVGLISEFAGVTAINNAQPDNLGAAGAFKSNTVELDYDGDFRPFRAFGATMPGGGPEVMNSYPDVLTTPAGTAGNPATWIPITLRCLDDYQAVESGHGFAGVGAGEVVRFFVVDTNELTSTITLVAVNDSGNASSFNLQALMPVGWAMGVEMGDSITMGARSFGNVTCWSTYKTHEMTGILSNLYDNTFGERTRVTLTYKALRSTAFTMNTTAAGGRAAFGPSRVVQFIDRVNGYAGEKPSELWVSPLFNSIYVAAVSSIQNMNTGGRWSGDAVPSATTLAGYTMKTMRRMPRGLLLFSSPSTWFVLTPQKGGGLGGVPMLRFRDQLKGVDSETHLNSSTTVWGVFQLCCKEPRKNGTICGVNIVSEILD